MYVDQYEELRNPHHLGRGELFFCPPLLATGGVNTTAYGRRWGTNWPATPDIPGQPRMAPGRSVGNCRALSVTPSIRRLATSAWDARGNALVESVAASVTLYGHGSSNLVDALHGLRRQFAGSPLTEQIRTGGAGIDAGSTLFVRHLVDGDKPLTVAPSWTTWSEGVHYKRVPFGIQMLAGFSAPLGSSVVIGYTPEGSTENIDALANLQLELGLVFVGKNRIDGRATRLEVFRARPALEGAFQSLNESISTITLNFSIQPVRSAAGRQPDWYRITRGRYPTH